MIVVGRAINGVGINGLEYLLDPENDNDYMKFENTDAAKEFLREHAFPDSTDEELEGYFTFLAEEDAP